MEIRHKDLGARIRAARNAKEWKQKELAAACHVEPVTVSRWERGANTPDLATVGRIAQALDVNVRDLMPDAPLEQSELQEIRGEVRELRDAVLDAIDRIDRLLQELDPPHSEKPG